MFNLNLRSARGAFPVGAVELRAPVPRIRVGTATLPTNEPALVLEEVAFTAYYPADLSCKPRPRRGLNWLVRPVRATLKGYVRFSGLPAWLLWPVLYLFGMRLKIPAYKNAPLLHPGDGSWPLVIFSHGLVGSRTAYSQLCSEMAAAGKIVLAIEHRDGTGPACTSRIPDDSGVLRERTVLYCREDDVVFPPETEEETTPRVLPLRVDQLVFRQQEVYRIYEAFCALVRDGVALKELDGGSVDLKSWINKSGKPLVNCEDVALVGHSFGGCTVLSILSSPPPSSEFAPIPFSKAILYDPWLEPLPSPGPTPTSSVPELSKAESGLENGALAQKANGRLLEQMLVINSQVFTLWTVHFTRLAEVVKAWEPNGRRLLTLVGSQHASFSDFPVLPLVRTKTAVKLMDRAVTLSLAFLDGTLDATLERLPTKKFEEKIVGKRKDGRPKRIMVGEVGDVSLERCGQHVWDGLVPHHNLTTTIVAAAMVTYKHCNPSTRSLSDDDDDDNHHSIEFAAEDSTDALVVSPAQWTRNKRLSLVPAAAALGPMARVPPELLIHILKHLHAVKDLHTALQVCRTWCECSVELLWHKPAFPKYDTLVKMTTLLDSPDQTFTYASFIRRLNLLSLGKDLRDRTFSTLAHCSRLERLTLVNCDHISTETLNKVLPCFANLVAIDLTGVVNTSNTAIVGLASSATRLQGINLAGCKRVSDRGILALAAHCPLLRRVKLSYLEQITDRSVSALALSCPLLLEIDLNHCKLVTDISVRDIWTHSNHMREMRLSHCPELTDAGFPSPIKADSSGVDTPNPFPSATTSSSDELPPLVLNTSFEHLRMLDLTACSQVTDDAVDGIIAHAPRIRNLVLSKCSLLTDRSVENICKLGRYLHYLHLGHAAKITDRSVRTLARSCTRLRYVDFANCVLLTDMSVFELSALPKLRRVGLVRVNNLTDEAIFSLADRHATLERIHLSYCDQISVMAVHFLLQKLHKLTHLSLTGVPAFRQPELQRFCREPPHEFSSTQQMAFCVYSGKGVSQLRAFLTELFDHLTEMNGTDDTEDEEDEIDAEAYREDDTPEPDPEDIEEEDEFGSRRMFLQLQQLASARGTRGSAVLPTHPPPPVPGNDFGYQRPTRASTLPPLHPDYNSQSTTSRLRDAATRLNNQIAASPAPVFAGPSRIGVASRQAPRGVADMLPIVETSRSPPPSERSIASGGGGFFRTYQQDPGSPRNGALTPDLNYAEIGHGRGAVPHSHREANQMHGERHVPRRGEGMVPRQRPPFVEMDSNGSSASVGNSQGPASHANRPANIEAPSATASVVWPYREPASPTSSTTTRELQESVALALGGGAAPHGGGESRGRSVKRSLRNTLNAAEQYASSLIFGRRSPPVPDDGAGPSSSGANAGHH
ncbi:SCF E3 ubiquitin ligase complex F-box protein GrrA [Favolaschia claudopus]|uniref:1-alkyl-2-acetylglycerophosphocholine esterase n=1 Tax=Favolaschia claudopus TaxID=2862362 RepID=A0AAW0ECR9_9AGAR